MKTTLLIYAKNEIDGMRVIMPQIDRSWCDEIIVIDGHSTDGTYEYCVEHGYPVYKQEKPSWSGAYYEGHKHATGDILVDFSPDGNSDPQKIPELIREIKAGYDLVIASRYLGDAKSDDDTPLTAFGNWLFTTAINLLFGAHYTDTLVIFRAYRKNLLTETFLDRELVHAFTPQSCIRAAKLGKRVKDIPASEPPRIGGESKMRPLYCGWLAVEIILKELFDRRLVRKAPPQ